MGFASQEKYNCMQTHMKEAINLNIQRRPLYAKEDWRAYIISSLLIWSEKFTLSFIAPKFDENAKLYQKNGIGIMCDEFIDMDKTPKFQARKNPWPDIKKYVPPQVNKIKESLIQGVRKQSFDAVKISAEEVLENLSVEPQFNCMTKHLLESVARASALAPKHIARAEAIGLSSPAPLIWEFIESHIDSISYSLFMEKLAAKVQSKGIPIICNDVPHIPLVDDFSSPSI